MNQIHADLSVIVPALAVAFLAACFDGAQSPQSRPESPQAEGEGEGALAPVDLVYLCGNKFLVTNSTKSPAHVEYRVVDSDETGSLTLQEGLAEDPGFSETPLETKARGVVELYQDGQRIARRRNGGTACGAPAISASVAGVSSPTAGDWSAPFPLPIVALHLSLLPTGKVLMWGHWGTPQVWDPATGNLTAVPSPALLFCAGHSFLADGRLLVSGGHISDDHGIPDNTIFTPGSQIWSTSTPMVRGRWYPTNTTLANGDVLITAGRDEAGTQVEEPEVWSASSGTLRVLTGAKRTLPYYPRTFLAPDGRVFYAGEQQTTRYLDPAGPGSWTTVASRHYPLRDYGSAVMYDEGKILYAGGGRTTNTAEIIDLNSAAPAWQLTGSMAFPRRHLNATVLPTGEVLATGGSSGTAFDDWSAGVHAAELWNPATGIWTTLASNTVSRTYHSTSVLLPDGRILHSGSGDGAGSPDQKSGELFSPPYLFKGPRPVIGQAPSAVAYGSSFTVTTPDAADIGNVSLVRLGSVTHAFDMNQRFQWLSFTRDGEALTVTAPTNHNRTPPGHYMLFILNGDGVPSVAKILRVGGTGDPPLPPSSINLAATGRVDATKQYMTLDWTGAVGASVDVFRNGARLTATNNDGHYVNSRTFSGPATYVYKLCQPGTTTCSNEATVEFGGEENTPPSASFTQDCAGLACSFTDGSDDTDGSVTGWAWDFGDESSASERNSSHTYAGAGTYTVTLTVTDDDGAPGSTSRQVTVSSTGSSITLTVSGRQDATKQYMTLDWAGSTGASVDVFRNGPLLTTTANDGHYTNSRSFTGSATYTYKVCQAGTSVCSNEATVEFGGGAPPGNTAPIPNYTFSCTGSDCDFTDESTDADGTIVSRTWAFGDGSNSTATNPSHTYASSGTYTVTLTVTDNGGATRAVSKQVTVSGPASPIVLTASGRSEGSTQFMTLDWTGATGTAVDVLRNGVRLGSTPNDGHYVNRRNFTGAVTYVYKVCNSGTTTCSNEATVEFR